MTSEPAIEVIELGDQLDHERCCIVDRRRCTGLTAAWCPIHGDCSCLRSHEDPRFTDEADAHYRQEPSLDDGDCSLHAQDSDHPRASAEAWATTMGVAPHLADVDDLATALAHGTASHPIADHPDRTGIAASNLALAYRLHRAREAFGHRR